MESNFYWTNAKNRMKLYRKVLNLYLVEENLINFKSSRPEVFCKKDVLRNFAKFTGKHQLKIFFFIAKEILTEVFPCEFCKISKKAFSYRLPLVVASKPFMTQTRCVCRVVEHSSMCVLRYFKDTMCWTDA